MKTSILLMIICTPLMMQAQEEEGIHFEKRMTWDQIKEKAKEENKYIFIDCYATWCAPCKLMERDIFPLEKVGKLYNEKFVSIKVQADRTEKDNGTIKSWYNVAEKITTQYKVSAYPTFLYLTPEGKLMHRASGAFDIEQFMTLANDAIEQKGYASLVERFTKGEYRNLDLKELVNSAKYAGNDSLAKAIATVYVQTTDIKELIKQDNMVLLFELGQNDKAWAQQVCMPKIRELSIDQLANPVAIRFLLYAAKNKTLASQVTDQWISSMTDEALFTKDTLQYLASFMGYSTDKSFALFQRNAKRINKIIGEKNWVQGPIDAIIINEEFYEPVYYPAAKLIQDGRKVSALTEPDWKKLQATITTKYSAACARRLQFSPKMYWNKLVGNKKGYIKNLLAEIDRTGGWKLNGMALNNSAMEVFRYSTSKKELEKAAGWMRKYFEKNPKEIKTNAGAIDTYAILLYKAGKVKEGIAWEQKAAIIDPGEREIASNLSNMKKGLPIWPDGYNVIK
ncbi:MAG: DUF255 domain-containing protein [Chitinophagaceae bacterium]